MLVIPLQALPNQVVTVSLANQTCQISVYQLSPGLFCNVYVNNVLVVAGVICQNINRIVREAYLGFIGDLIFMDLQGDTDPYYTGLGSRFQLLYLEAQDLP